MKIADGALRRTNMPAEIAANDEQEIGLGEGLSEVEILESIPKKPVLEIFVEIADILSRRKLISNGETMARELLEQGDSVMAYSKGPHAVGFLVSKAVTTSLTVFAKTLPLTDRETGCSESRYMVLFIVPQLYERFKH